MGRRPRRPTDDELAASESRLRLLLGLTRGIVFEFDRDARYLAAWTHDEALLARPVDELIGKTIDEILGEDGRRFTEAVRRVFDSGAPETIVYELPVRGGRRWFSADVVVPPKSGRRGRTVVYLVRDITQHVQLEEQVRHAQRMEAVGRLASGIAHDFNNILTTIIGYSDMLLNETEDAVQAKKLTKIRNSAERAAALTNQLLAYSRERVYVPEDVDLNATITATADILRGVLGARVVLRLELEAKLPLARVDRAGLEQIILNLTLNARDALSGGGTLELRTSSVQLEGLTPGSFVVLTATDDGCGMRPETRERIFEPFFTTKPIGAGTGLGLSTVYGMVKQAGGHVEVESELGDGTTLRVFLPRVARRRRSTTR